MSVSHMAIFVYMAMVHIHIWCQNWGISFMIWLRTGFPRVLRRRSEKQARNNEESISEWLVQAIEREKGNTRPPEKRKENAIEETRKCGTPQKSKRRKSPTLKTRKTQLQGKKKGRHDKKEKKKEVKQLNAKTRKKKRRKKAQKRKRIRRYLFIRIIFLHPSLFGL